MKYCYHCGQAMGEDFTFCPVCGKAAPAPQSLYSTAMPPVYMAEPVQTSTVGGRVMAGLSKGFGITEEEALRRTIVDADGNILCE